MEQQPYRETAVLGLVADDPLAYARARGALCVAYDVTRAPLLTPRAWLAQVASIEGRSSDDADGLADALTREAGLLPPGAGANLASLDAWHRTLLSLAEAAVQARARPCVNGSFEITVVVPEPPLAWPVRTDARRAAVRLLAGTEVILHAREAWELAPHVERDFIVGESGASFVPPDGSRSLLTRVYGSGEPYRAFREALDSLGVEVQGGPIAHVLCVPKGVGPREVLAAAYGVGLDILEVRDVFDAPRAI